MFLGLVVDPEVRDTFDFSKGQLRVQGGEFYFHICVLGSASDGRMTSKSESCMAYKFV